MAKTICAISRLELFFISQRAVLYLAVYYGTLCRKTVFLCAPISCHFGFIESALISSRSNGLAFPLKTTSQSRGNSQVHSHTTSDRASLGYFASVEGHFWVKINTNMGSEEL